MEDYLQKSKNTAKCLTLSEISKILELHGLDLNSINLPSVIFNIEDEKKQSYNERKKQTKRNKSGIY